MLEESSSSDSELSPNFDFRDYNASFDKIGQLFAVLAYGQRINNYHELKEIFTLAYQSDKKAIEVCHISERRRCELQKDHTNLLEESSDKFTFYAEVQLLSEMLKSKDPVVDTQKPELGMVRDQRQSIHFCVNRPKLCYSQCVLLIVESSLLTGNPRANDMVIAGSFVRVEGGTLTLTIPSKGYGVLNPDIKYTVFLKPTCNAFDDLINAIIKMNSTPTISEKIFGTPAFEIPKKLFLEKREKQLKPYFARRNDGTNEFQQEAIYSILKMSGDFPFILFGPPGTGKTTTLVNAVNIILEEDPNCKILVCTPSNAAADNFALSLLKLNEKGPPASKILRLMSARSPLKDVHPDLQKISLNDGHKFILPDNPRILMKYSVIISTIGSCSRIRTNQKFSHIFIDEAGQATEADSWIPIAVFGKNPSTKIILAGDPQQLGPVLIDPVLEEKSFCYEKSLLVRLSAMPEFKDDERLMVQLRHNYRSHESIVLLASGMFYDNTLIETQPEGHDAFVASKILAGLYFPILFHAVYGREVGEQSFYNEQEIDVVVGYVTKLLMDGAKPKLMPGDIGIVSPYREQAARLKRRLRQYPSLTIDTVERFQGSERKVIIITTTRTSNIGFLRDGKRTNTAITRARQLLIIVGHPELLNRDPSWALLIDCLKKNDCYTEGRSLEINKVEDTSEAFQHSKAVNIAETDITRVGLGKAVQEYSAPLSIWD